MEGEDSGGEDGEKDEEEENGGTAADTRSAARYSGCFSRPDEKTNEESEEDKRRGAKEVHDAEKESTISGYEEDTRLQTRENESRP